MRRLRRNSANLYTMNLRVASVTEDNNGAVPEDGALAVEGLAQPCPVSFYENLPPLEEKLLDGAEGDPPTILPPYNRGGGGGMMGRDCRLHQRLPLQTNHPEEIMPILRRRKNMALPCNLIQEARSPAARAAP